MVASHDIVIQPNRTSHNRGSPGPFCQTHLSSTAWLWAKAACHTWCRHQPAAHEVRDNPEDRALESGRSVGINDVCLLVHLGACPCINQPIGRRRTSMLGVASWFWQIWDPQTLLHQILLCPGCPGGFPQLIRHGHGNSTSAAPGRNHRGDSTSWGMEELVEEKSRLRGFVLINWLPWIRSSQQTCTLKPLEPWRCPIGFEVGSLSACAEVYPKAFLRSKQVKYGVEELDKMGITLTLLSWDDSRIMPPTQSRANHFIDSKVSLRWAVRLPIRQHYKWIRIVVLPYILVSSIRILVAQIRSHWGHCFLVFQAEPSMMVPNKNIRHIMAHPCTTNWSTMAPFRMPRYPWISRAHSPSRCKKLNCFTSALLGFAASSLAQRRESKRWSRWHCELPKLDEGLVRWENHPTKWGNFQQALSGGYSNSFRSMKLSHLCEGKKNLAEVSPFLARPCSSLSKQDHLRVSSTCKRRSVQRTCEKEC